MALIRCLINGEQAQQISILDRGFQYGDGLFETLAIIKGNVHLWDAHYARLETSCAKLSIICPEQTLLQHELSMLVPDNGHYAAKITLTRGMSERGYASNPQQSGTRVINIYDWPIHKKTFWHNGIKVKICETTLMPQGQLAGIKHLNRLEQVLARQEWQGQQYQEGLMLDMFGNVVEGISSNLFIVDNDTLITPDLSEAGVNGIMRNTVMELAQSNHIDVNIKNINFNQLHNVSEIFLTNSLIGIWPVQHIENVSAYKIGTVTKTLMQLLKAQYDIHYDTPAI